MTLVSSLNSARDLLLLTVDAAFAESEQGAQLPLLQQLTRKMKHLHMPELLQVQKQTLCPTLRMGLEKCCVSNEPLQRTWLVSGQKSPDHSDLPMKN